VEQEQRGDPLDAVDCRQELARGEVAGGAEHDAARRLQRPPLEPSTSGFSTSIDGVRLASRRRRSRPMVSVVITSVSVARERLRWDGARR
jgi:hypothetical protein